MKITVYNVKGGVGKTDIALNLALTLDIGIITNEPYSPLENILDESSLIKLDHDENIPKLPKDFPAIFDLGGYLDLRAVSALHQSNCVIVPVVNEFKDVDTTVNFIQEIEEHNSRIIIVANKAQKGDLEDIQEIMGENYPNYPVLAIKQTRALPNIMKEKKSIHAMAEEGGLKAFYCRPVAEQFDKLIKTINQYN